MVSTRFAPAVAALLMLALVPTVLHSYMKGAIDDGRAVAGIPTYLAGMQGVSSDRRAEWMRTQFESTDFIDRRYAQDLTLVVVRSLNAKTLYHHPELALAYGDSYSARQVVRFPQRADVPVHVLVGDNNQRLVSMYVMSYDDRFVEDPIKFQFQTALKLLVSRRRPMTLFYVKDRAAQGQIAESSRAASLLLAAVDTFKGQSGHRR